MMFDTHAHLNFDAFKDDREEVIDKCLKQDIWIINIGSQYSSSEKAVAITRNYTKGVYAAVGLHPINLETDLVKRKLDSLESLREDKEEFFDYEKYRQLASQPKVVAIGEIGLDYYYRPKSQKKKLEFKEKQKELLLKQLDLAKELKLPVIFHSRVAHQDLINVLLENPKLRPKKAVAHGFVGTIEELKKYLDLGFFIGFNGIIFKSIQGINFEENIKETPLNRILLETDCPYLNPVSLEERNDPFKVREIGERIAEIKNLSYEKTIRETFQNACNLFQL